MKTVIYSELVNTYFFHHFISTREPQTQTFGKIIVKYIGNIIVYNNAIFIVYIVNFTIIFLRSMRKFTTLQRKFTMLQSSMRKFTHPFVRFFVTGVSVHSRGHKHRPLHGHTMALETENEQMHGQSGHSHGLDYSAHDGLADSFRIGAGRTFGLAHIL